MKEAAAFLLDDGDIKPTCADCAKKGEQLGLLVFVRYIGGLPVYRIARGKTLDDVRSAITHQAFH